MKEKALQFGKSAVLSGVLTEPDVASRQPPRPAFILLNAGILHRVGSCRLHVSVARNLAEHGFTSLRFDFSGIGDSEPRRDSLPFEESSRLEVREAMDYLAASRGINSFVLMGLCSGADMAHLTAVEDERVSGLVLLDAWAYRTPGYWFHYYAQRVFRAEVWKNWAAIRLRRLRGEESVQRHLGEAGPDVCYDVPKYVRAFPPKEKVERELSRFMKRGIRMFVIFTGGLSDHFNHRGQYRSAFRQVDFGDRLRLEFLRTSDHILTNLEHQRYVVSEVASWADANMQGVAAGEAADSPALAVR